MKKLFLFFIISYFFVLTFNCSSKVEKVNLSTPGFIIDGHRHFPINIKPDGWKNMSLTVYKKYNAMGCFFVPMKNLEIGIKFAKANPERVIPYAAIDIDSPTVLEYIQRTYDMGYKGLGELFARNQWNYNDPKYDPVWALAEKLGMPINLHTGILPDGHMSTMRPSYLGTIAKKFPNLIIIGAHFGEPWYEEASAVAMRCKNVYFDITGTSLIRHDENPEIWKKYLWWTPFLDKDLSRWHIPQDLVPAFEKIVFGTDDDMSRMEEIISGFNRMLDANNVSDATRAMCYYGTLARIHNIDVSKYLKK